jgi:hypothetical protein
MDEILFASIFQKQRTKWHDNFIKKKVFQKGYLALLYDSRFKHFKGKLCTRWLGPYEVDTLFENGIVKFTTIDDSHTPLFANGNHLRLYHQPPSKDSFVSNILSDVELQFVGVGNPTPTHTK